MVLPSIGPIFIAVLVMLLQFAIKTYDLVVALTAGGPGLASTLPALVVYDFMFQRGELGARLGRGGDAAGLARRRAGAVRCLRHVAPAAACAHA